MSDELCEALRRANYECKIASLRIEIAHLQEIARKAISKNSEESMVEYVLSLRAALREIAGEGKPR
jgi:hypothetical protein